MLSQDLDMKISTTAGTNHQAGKGNASGAKTGSARDHLPNRRLLLKASERRGKMIAFGY